MYVHVFARWVGFQMAQRIQTTMLRGDKCAVFVPLIASSDGAVPAWARDTVLCPLTCQMLENFYSRNDNSSDTIIPVPQPRNALIERIFKLP